MPAVPLSNPIGVKLPMSDYRSRTFFGRAEPLHKSAAIFGISNWTSKWMYAKKQPTNDPLSPSCPTLGEIPYTNDGTLGY